MYAIRSYYESQGLVRLVESQPLQGVADVLLDTALVLAGGRDDAGVANDALVVHVVAVPEESARRLGAAEGVALARITSYNVCYTKLLR